MSAKKSVRDLMTRPAATVRPEDSLEEAVRLMRASSGSVFAGCASAPARGKLAATRARRHYRDDGKYRNDRARHEPPPSDHR